ncbi:MAG: hypothetical protein QOI63_612 [Thermoplasmata archaeon]|nr:hypothetical protein [Thermoplasmata archaeon]
MGLRGGSVGPVCGTTFDVPSSPTHLEAAPGKLPSEVDLTWDAPAVVGSPGIQSYILHWGLSAASQPNNLAVPADTTYTDKPWTNGAPAGQPIYYAVSVVNDAGLESLGRSNVACAVPKGTPVLTAPPCEVESSFQETEILRQDIPIGGQHLDVPGVEVDLVTVAIGPDSGDPTYTDIAVTVAGQGLPPIGIYTAGLDLGMGAPIHILDVPATGIDVPQYTLHLVVTQTHDPQHHFCPTKVGGACPIDLPMDVADPTWFAGPGSQAFLAVQATLTGPGGTVADRTAFIPYVGQILIQPPSPP